MEKLCVFADDFDRQLPGALRPGIFSLGVFFLKPEENRLPAPGKFAMMKHTGGIML